MQKKTVPIIKKSTKDYLEEYTLKIYENQQKTYFIDKKYNKKIVDDDIPIFTEHKLFLQNNYSATQLKNIAKYYKLKITGNKEQLIKRIHLYLLLSLYALKIQKNIKGYIQRKYNKCRGPAFIDRTLCTNTMDFFTMDDIKDIPIDQFFSYKDTDGFIYGFDIMSLWNLIYKSTDVNSGVVQNPYNRRPIETNVINTYKQLFRLSKLLKIDICTEIQNIELEISNEKIIELNVLELFQTIDLLGNYSNPSWFLTLNSQQLIRFMRELVDIWTYRAQLSIEVKRMICPPLGDPFTTLSIHSLHYFENITDLRKYILSILNTLINSGISNDYKSLGAYYVLSALTLVNTTAANALPWLYQSVAYN
jgi:hypothetical protein